MPEDRPHSPLSREALLQKLKAYCAYQERSHQEVRSKAFELGLHAVSLDELIATLIEENYLNEERFAMQYAGGHFRLKHWGRLKIKYALRQKQVSEYSIKKALKAIDAEDYEKTLLKVAAQKKRELSSTRHPGVREQKLRQYLVSRGFEMELINDAIRQLNSEEP